MLIELHRKAGSLCQQAKEGHVRCPLIVRPTSEDNITDNLVSTLRVLNPRNWVSDFLNLALGTSRFHRQVYRRFRIEPWVSKPPFPRDLVPWEEGSTEVDVQISFENPPTTVYVECKYGCGLSTTTNANDGGHGYPSDQLIRNIRVGLLECGRYRNEALFRMQPRDFVVILLAPEKGHKLVEAYRKPDRLRSAVPHGDRIVDWPKEPFVGEISYRDVRKVLGDRRRFYTHPERQLIDALGEYLAYKHQTRPNRLPLASVEESAHRG